MSHCWPGPCGTGEAVCLFVPVLHFVLVPSLLLAGVALAVTRLRAHRSLVQVEGACPRCNVARTRPASGRFRDGRKVHREECGAQLEVRASPTGSSEPLA